MKINETRSQNISGVKKSVRSKDLTGTSDKITINSGTEPSLSVYGKADFKKEPSHGNTSNHWSIDDILSPNDGNTAQSSPENSNSHWTIENILSGSGNVIEPSDSAINPGNHWSIEDILSSNDGNLIQPSHGNSNPVHHPDHSSHIHGPAPGIYNQHFNNIMAVLNNVSCQTIQDKLAYAGNDIKTSKEELKSTHDTIEEVKKDTDETDVSSKGSELGVKINSVEDKLEEGSRYIDSASNDFNGVKSYLNDASGRIDALKSQLWSAGKYQQVISYLEQAKEYINKPLGNTGNVEWDLYYTGDYIKGALREISYGKSYINTIEGDYDGNSVSSEGYSLENYVNSAETSLDSANSKLSNTTGNYLPSLRGEIDGAINSLRYAQSLYNSIR